METHPIQFSAGHNYIIKSQKHLISFMRFSITREISLEEIKNVIKYAWWDEKYVKKGFECLIKYDYRIFNYYLITTEKECIFTNELPAGHKYDIECVEEDFSEDADLSKLEHLIYNPRPTTN